MWKHREADYLRLQLGIIPSRILADVPQNMGHSCRFALEEQSRQPQLGLVLGKDDMWLQFTCRI